MTLTYTGATGVFTHLGSLIARLNSYNALGLTTLPTDLTSLLTSFGLTWLPEEGVAAYYEGLRDSVTAWRQGLAGHGDRRLTDLATVVAPLGLQPGEGLESVLPALVRDMLDSAKTVKACTSAVGTVTYPATNKGNGKAWLTLELDGHTAPLLGAQPLVQYNGLVSQLTCPAETMTLECVADSVGDGLPEGGEAWRWTGGPFYGDLDVRAEGSGEGPGVQTADEGPTVLSGGSFDAWGSGVPSGWTRVSGTASGITQDTSTTLRAGSSAKFVGGPLLQLRQSLADSRVYGRRRYLLAAALKGSGVNAGATVRVYCSGTGFSPPGIDVPGASVPASWTPYGVWLTMPAPLPSNWSLTVEVQGLSTGSVWVDAVSLSPAVYHGGLAAGVTGGSVRWQKGDRCTWTVTNDQAGKFQTYFRRHHKTQLPAVKSGVAQGYFLDLPFLLMTATQSETVPDSLVA